MSSGHISPKCTGDFTVHVSECVRPPYLELASAPGSGDWWVIFGCVLLVRHLQVATTSCLSCLSACWTSSPAAIRRLCPYLLGPDGSAGGAVPRELYSWRAEDRHTRHFGPRSTLVCTGALVGHHSMRAVREIDIGTVHRSCCHLGAERRQSGGPSRGVTYTRTTL